MTEEQNKNINQTESGRSMVEMLGVLAIIGVLSIGGIAGYKMAMDKHKVNEIINGVGERSVVLSQKAIAGTTLSIPTEFGDKISGYAVELKDDVYEGAFRLTVSGVEKDICEKALEAGLQSAFQISVDETVIWEQGEKTGTISCKDTDNSLVYDFDAALDQEVVAVAAAAPATKEACEKASMKWCSYNSSCNTAECASPNSFSFNKEDCEAAGYVYHEKDPGGSSWAPNGCSPVELKAGTYNCNNGKTYLNVESEDYCPSKKYKTKDACEGAGFHWCPDCSYCILGPGCERC